MAFKRLNLTLRAPKGQARSISTARRTNKVKKKVRIKFGKSSPLPGGPRASANQAGAGPGVANLGAPPSGEPPSAGDPGPGGAGGGSARGGRPGREGVGQRGGAARNDAREGGSWPGRDETRRGAARLDTKPNIKKIKVLAVGGRQGKRRPGSKGAGQERSGRNKDEGWPTRGEGALAKEGRREGTTRRDDSTRRVTTMNIKMYEL